MKNLIVLLILLPISIGANAGIYDLKMPEKKPGILGIRDNIEPSTFDLKPDLKKCPARYHKIKEQQLILYHEWRENNKVDDELARKNRLDMMVYNAECIR